MRSVEEDLTARARIRDAALVRFAREGFSVGLRAIAADAGVSPALVIHHFGSKDGLRQACDEYAMTSLRLRKSESLTSDNPRSVLAQLADLAPYGALFGYWVRSLVSGGPLAARFVADMTAATEDYLAAGQAAGTVRPSRDAQARARYAVAQSIGLLQLALIEAEEGRAPSPTEDPVGALTRLTEWTALPALELYTEGLFTDEALLTAYLERADTDRSETRPERETPGSVPGEDR